MMEHSVEPPDAAQAERKNDLKTPIWQVKAHEQWVKTTMLSDLIEANDRVFEMCCGNGMDIGKWARSKIKEFVGIDSNEQHLNEAKERWEQKKKPFSAQFVRADLYKDSIDSLLSHNVVFDKVACFAGLSQSFASESIARNFLKNASRRLQPNGYFFGLVMDSSAIWYKAQKVYFEKHHYDIEGKYYSIRFDNPHFEHFGCKFTLYIHKEGGENTEVTSDYLVHFPSLIKFSDSFPAKIITCLDRIAAEYGLNMIEIENLNEYFEDNKKNYPDKLKELGVFLQQQEGKIDPHQKEIIGYYSNFVFQKVQT